MSSKPIQHPWVAAGEVEPREAPKVEPGSMTHIQIDSRQSIPVLFMLSGSSVYRVYSIDSVCLID